MKKDQSLGRQIQNVLIKKGIETPMLDRNTSPTAQRNEIEEHFRAIMRALNLDLEDDSLEGSPARIAKMYVDEVFYGLNYDNFPKCTTVSNKMQYDELVIVDNINLQSNCEHHFVVIDGVAHVGYIPGEMVLGLSKINRVVEFFAKRPQIQERLTEQIYYALSYILGTPDIAVQIRATHYCVKSRGIQDTSSQTTTSKMGGKFFENPTLRNEFLQIIHNGKNG